MSEPSSSIKLLTLAQANAALPRVRELLAQARRARSKIIADQALVDVEELIAENVELGRQRTLPILGRLEKETNNFHEAIEALVELGAELKDLERGLIDFYALRGQEIFFLCWKEDETSVNWWHPLHTGFGGRQPLDDIF